MNSAYYSEREPNTLDRHSRLSKAQKIWDVIQDFAPSDMSQGKCLDIGSSGGIITSFLGRHFKQVTGVDVDLQAMAFARSSADSPQVSFAVASGIDLPFKSETLDVIICNHIYEHVPSAPKLFDEIRRVLRPGGLCYLSCSNKYWILEPHYHLPFLSWLPRSWSHGYLRITGKGTYYEEQLLSHRALTALLQERRFELTEYTLRIFEAPERFHADNLLEEWPFARWIPVFMFRLLWFWLPTYVWMLRKPVR